MGVLGATAVGDAGHAILLTPPGAAAIAVVRLVGPGVGAFLSAHFSKPVRPGRPVHGTLADGPRVIDDPVVVTSAGGSVVDLNLHGGPWVVRSTLELARRAGFLVVPSPSAPGSPVPASAVDADSELEREVLTHLPLARTELGLQTLLAQPRAWAGLVAGASGAGGRERVRAVVEDRSLVHLLHPPRVALAGAANVGKSTLANRLFAQERSITADLPGTTRDWVGEVADLDGLAAMLLDTPGLRHTEDPLEREAVGRAREQVGRADLVVLVLDGACPLEPDQAPLLTKYPDALRVVNKSDRPPAWDVSAVGPRGAALATVATTGQGVDDLRAAVCAHFGCGPGYDPNRPRWWTPRQRAIVARAVEMPGALHDM